MTRLNLYGTSGCHLCEDALAILLQLKMQHSMTLTQIDIADDDSLYEQYSMTIPVLFSPETGVSLIWPFDRAQVENFLSGIKK